MVIVQIRNDIYIHTYYRRFYGNTTKKEVILTATLRDYFRKI